jgi:DMSO/TMAO reductase YedYZ heme-binding membrane subunit
VLRGWRLVGIASAALVASQLALFAAGGTDEAGVRFVVRASARISFLLFLPVYLAAPLRSFWSTPATRWLRVNRRYLGVGFAVAHFLHLMDIGLLALLLGDAFQREAVAILVGGASYVLLAAMLFTSFDRTARWLGPVWWNRLHRTGLHLLWFIFAQSYTFSALQDPYFVPFALAVWGALGLRIAAWRARRRSVGAAQRAPARAA